MRTPSIERPPTPRDGSRAGWLLATPAVTGLAMLLATDRVHLGAAAGDALAFIGGVLASVVPLALASPARLPRRLALGLPLLCTAALVAASLWARHPPAPLVNLTLVGVAHAIGTAIGRRVQHPGHLLPACIVAAAADAASVLHPAGPSHAIAASDAALSVLSIQFPVPGAPAVAPVLGVGDLVFFALVLGVVTTHGLSVLRASLLGLAGALVAGALAAWLRAPIPALIPIAGFIAGGLPAARRLRPEDRRVTWLVAVLAVGVALGVVVQR